MTHAEFPLVGKVVSRYELRGGLGRGGFADVYRAWDQLDEREVAVKMLKVPAHLSAEAQAEFIRKFQDEARVTRKVFQGHPNVRQVLDMGVWTGPGGELSPWMAMELLEGETLAESLQKRRRGAARRTEAEVLAFFGPVLEAVTFAHDKGIVHRDLKPANIFLARQGNEVVLKVLDFGIAKVLQGDELASGNTQTSSTLQMFSPQYGAPEQFAAKKTGKYTDVFALGLILTELLTDQAPLSEDGDRTECMSAALDKRERPTPRARGGAVSDAVEAVIHRAVAVREQDRFPDARALHAALREAIGSGDARPTPEPVETVEARREAAVRTGFAERIPEFRGAKPPEPKGASRAEDSARTSFAEQVPEFRGAKQPTATPPAESVPQEAPPEVEPRGGTRGVKVLALTLAGLVGVTLAASAIHGKYASEPDVQADLVDAAGREPSSPIPVSDKDPSWGSEDALVTIVAFSEFQCPYCARVEKTLTDVKTTYGPEDLRVVWKNFPLETIHPNARAAAEAAHAVFVLKGNDAFWRFHEDAFENQKELSPENFEKWAVAAGISKDAFKQAVASEDVKAKVAADMALAKELGASGTPSFRINGIKLDGAQPVDRFKAIIDAELEKAKAKVAAGTPRRQIYAVLSSQNFEEQKDASAEEQQKDEIDKDDSIVWKVHTGTSPALGPDDAPVTIVEFGDFQCPFCARVQDTLKQLRKDYPNDVRIVWKDEVLPFHQRAEPAAQLAREARAQKGDAAFWRAHDALFESQPKLDDADLETIARGLGLDVSSAMAAVKDHRFKAEIDADAKAAEEIRAEGTPHFFINGRRLVGAQPIERFKALIDDELAKFKASGATRSGYYERIMLGGRTASDAPIAKVTIQDLVVGTGAEAKAGDRIKAHYIGTLIDGVQFDSSYKHGQPLEVTIGKQQVIKGWDQGIPGMKVGGKRRLTIPPSLGYGAKGIGKIPPNATLVFEVELLDVTKGD